MLGKLRYVVSMPWYAWAFCLFVPLMAFGIPPNSPGTWLASFGVQFVGMRLFVELVRLVLRVVPSTGDDAWERLGRWTKN